MPSAVSLLGPIVLVVEDDALLRLLAVDLVESAGYQAIEAGSADEACGILEHRADIRLVFTDVDMPGSMDGLELAVMIRDRWPPIEIIITSGVRGPKDADLPARARFFAKPYSADHVTTAIRTLVEQP
ncbi:MAG TPA: response regulator [Candidatus Cybelea sp.]|nr:response regulator [Candidatus Cybelea sp.]